jgi:hypothetical protein
MVNYFKKNTPELNIFVLSIVIVSIFINNTVFYMSLCFLYLYKNVEEFKIKTQNEKKLLLSTPIIFYIVKFYQSIQREDLLFWDNQYLFIYFNCNKGLTSHRIYLDDVSYTCISDLGFGIISKYISTSLNSWHASIILFSLVSIVLIFFISKVNDNNLYLLIFFILSPAFRFLLFSLNSDIFILLTFIYLIYKTRLEFNLIHLLVLSVLIQFKIYPLGVLLGYIFYNLIKKDFTHMMRNLFFAVMNLLIIYFDSILDVQNQISQFVNTFLGIPYVYAPIYSFGVLADYKTYFEVQLSPLENFSFLRILIFISFLTVFILFKNSEFENYKYLSEYQEKIFVFFTPMVLFVNFFGNYAYKLPFNFLLISVFFLNSKKSLKIIFGIFILFNPLFYFLNFEYAHNLFDPTYINSLSFIFSRVSFYTLNLFFLTQFYNIAKKNILTKSD